MYFLLHRGSSVSMIAAFWEMIFLMCCSRSCGFVPLIVVVLDDEADAPPDPLAPDVVRDLGRISAAHFLMLF